MEAAGANPHPTGERIPTAAAQPRNDMEEDVACIGGDPSLTLRMTVCWGCGFLVAMEIGTCYNDKNICFAEKNMKTLLHI